MHILVFSWRDPRHPLAGGAEQVVLEHAKGWIEAGHSVTWFSSKFDSSQVCKVVDGVSVVRSGNQYLGVQITAFFYYVKNSDKYDIVIDQFHGIPFFTPLYVKKPILALIQEVAGKVWLLNPLPFPMNLIVGFIGYVFEPFIFLFYMNCKFMVGSNSAKEDLIKFGIPLKNITVVPHGVLLPKHEVRISKSETKTITFLGTLAKDKGIEDAIGCFSLLNKTGEYNFWIIGKPETDDYFEKIKSKISSLGLNGKVKLWGKVSDEKKFELLARSHVLVNPSAHEGWGLVNIEANAMGTPVVAYKSAGLIDSVREGESGMFCKENTPESLAETVNVLLRSKEKYSLLCIQAKTWANKFNWNVSRNISLKLIEKVA